MQVWVMVENPDEDEKGMLIEPWEEDASSAGENIKTQIRGRRYYGPR
jgi:hypothetical protein